MMETRNLRVQFNKSKSGSISPRVSLPTSWMEKMDITLEDREVIVALLDNNIAIRKNAPGMVISENSIEERVKNMSFSKSGNKSKSTTVRIILPMTFVQHLGLNMENRDIEVTLDDDNTIIIQKQK